MTENKNRIVKNLLKETRYKVLSFLLDNPDIDFTITEIARRAEVSKPSVSSFVKELEEIGLIERRKKGRSHIVQVNKDSKYYSGLKDVLELDVEPLEEVAKEFAEEAISLDKDVRSVYLYGSVARGTSGIDSDIDVLVVTGSENESLENKLIKLKRNLEERYCFEISIMFYVKSELLKDLERGNKFAENLEKEAKLLNGKEIF